MPALSSLSHSAARTPACTTIDAITLRRWLADGDEIALFDVREAGRFGEGHPFFAVPLPYSRLEIDVVRLAPRRAVRLVLIDDAGAPDGPAARAARRLTRLAYLGYERVAIVAGGLGAWAAAGFTLFKGVNLPSKTFGELVERACGTPRISASELAARQATGARLALLDGRTVDEHSKMTIPGSRSCPNGELAYRLDEIVTDPATTIIINCAGRTRSIIGAQTLRNLGVPNPVLALENGTQGWTLAGFELEHGSTRRYPDTIGPAALAAAAQRAAALALRAGVMELTATQARRWIDDPQRTTFILDVRTPEEFAQAPIAGATSAPGGQLLQATDQYVGVRGARLLLVDGDAVRAPVIASWLMQMGYETAVLAPGMILSPPEQTHELPTKVDGPRADSIDGAAGAPAAADAPGAALPQLDSAALARLMRSGTPLLLDLRSSAAFRSAHAQGASWSIRPLLNRPLRGDPQPTAGVRTADRTLILFADTPAIAALAARDLREAGYENIHLAAAGLQAWRDAGLPVSATPQEPTDDERIDYLFFVHDRHDGNHDAARRYLEWETGLLAQCAPDELASFKPADALAPLG